MTTTRDKTLFLCNTTKGGTHAFRGARLSKLVSALKRCEGGEILTALVDNGYTETLGGLCVDSLTYEDVQKEIK